MIFFYAATQYVESFSFQRSFEILSEIWKTDAESCPQHTYLSEDRVKQHKTSWTRGKIVLQPIYEKIVENKRMSAISPLPYFGFSWLVILPRICFDLYELSLMLIGDIFCNPSDDLGLHCLCLFAWEGEEQVRSLS